MANVNKVIMIGNVTKAVELIYLTSQTAVANFGIAVNRKWKTEAGETKEEVCFLDCQAFAKTAETINKYVKKGDPIYVEGRLKYETWEKDGIKHSKHRLTVEKFQFLTTKAKTESAATEPECESVPF